MTVHSAFVCAVERQYDALVVDARAAGLSDETAHRLAFQQVKFKGIRALEDLRRAGLYPFVEEIEGGATLPQIAASGRSPEAAAPESDAAEVAEEARPPGSPAGGRWTPRSTPRSSLASPGIRL